MEESGGDARRIQLEIGQDPGHLHGVYQVGGSRAPDLPVVDLGRVDVGPADLFDIGLRIVRGDLIEDLVDSDH